MLAILEVYLKRLGQIQVSRAEGRSTAISQLASAAPRVDCIICDYSMEDGNGLQLLQAIRSGKVAGTGHDACFILLTATASQGVLDLASRLDVSAFLTKPATPDTIRTALAQAKAKSIVSDAGMYTEIAVPEEER